MLLYSNTLSCYSSKLATITLILKFHIVSLEMNEEKFSSIEKLHRIIDTVSVISVLGTDFNRVKETLSDYKDEIIDFLGEETYSLMLKDVSKYTNTIEDTSIKFLNLKEL